MSKAGGLFANVLVQKAFGVFRGRLDVGSTSGSNWLGEGNCSFEVDLPFTAAQLNAGSITLIEPNAVPRGMRLYVTDWAIRFGGVAFATATTVRLTTLAGTGDTTAVTDFVTVAVANSTGYVTRGSGTTPSTGVTQASAFVNGSGGTVNQGLALRLADGAGANIAGTGGAAGSVYVRGYFGL